MALSFSEREIRAMEVMRNRGKTYLDIAISFGVSPTTIKNAIDRAKQKEKAKKHKSSYSELRNAQKKKIEEGWMAYKNFVDIAKEAGVSSQLVGAYINNEKLHYVDIPKFDIDKIRARTAENVRNKGVMGRPPLSAYCIPCPLIDCSERENCTEINEPQNCKVWKLKFDEETKKRIANQNKRSKK